MLCVFHGMQTRLNLAFCFFLPFLARKRVKSKARIGTMSAVPEAFCTINFTFILKMMCHEIFINFASLFSIHSCTLSSLSLSRPQDSRVGGGGKRCYIDYDSKEAMEAALSGDVCNTAVGVLY